MWYWNFHSIHKWDLSENIIRPTAVSKEPSWQISIYVYSTWYMVPLRYMEYRSRSVNLVFAQKEAQIFFMWTKIAFQYISFQHWITCFSLLWSKTQNRHNINKTSQELRMLSRSLSDCKSLLLNLNLNLNRCLCLCSDCSDCSEWSDCSDCSDCRLWLLVGSDRPTDRQCHLLSCPGQLKRDWKAKNRALVPSWQRFWHSCRHVGLAAERKVSVSAQVFSSEREYMHSRTSANQEL